MKLFTLLLTLGLSKVALCGYYNWDVTWVTAAPDGFSRPVIGINGAWPPPTLVADVGERVTVTVNNKLGNETTSIHWHGIRMEGTTGMDGATGVSQCPVPPGVSVTYSWVADSAGTFWYHAHNMGQYPDGLRAPLIVKDASPPFEFDDQFTITLSDWYHAQSVDLIKAYQSPNNSDGAEPVPDSIIMNDNTGADFAVEAGKTYLFRILNIGAFPSFWFNIDGHNMTVVEMDSVYTQPTPAQTIYLGAAMRYGVLVTVANGTQNFDISALVDNSMFPTNYTGSLVASGSLVVSDSADKATPRSADTLNSTIMPPIDDITILPLDNQDILSPVTTQIILDFDRTLINGIPRAIINNSTYLSPKVPSLYTALTTGRNYNMNTTVYGTNTNPYVANYNDVIELVINNHTPNLHPWHLHGHKFQVVARSESNAVLNGSVYDGTNLPAIPMRRDTAGVQDGGYLVLRFRADNPGIQLLHCHIEWHVEAGLTATIIEAADRIAPFNLPPDMMNACNVGGMPFMGNAAGNTRDVLDLDGANTEVSVESVAMGAVYPGTSQTKRRKRSLGASWRRSFFESFTDM